MVANKIFLSVFSKVTCTEWEGRSRTPRGATRVSEKDIQLEVLIGIKSWNGMKFFVRSDGSPPTVWRQAVSFWQRSWPTDCTSQAYAPVLTQKATQREYLRRQK